MTPQDRQQLRNDLFERMLDGLPVSPEEMSEAGVAPNDPDLVSLRRAQAALDESLSRIVVPPAEPRLPLAGSDSIGTPRSNGVLGPVVASKDAARSARDPHRRRTWVQPLAAAAAVGGLLFAGWMAWTTFAPVKAPATTYQIVRVRGSMANVYATERSDGFIPDWVCSDDTEFAQTFQREVGQGLMFRPDESAGRLMVGLAYDETISPTTVHMLGRAKGVDIIVFVGRVEHDKAMPDVAADGLHLFRKQIDDLVLYELTPLPQPELLDFFVRADVSEAGNGG